MFSILSDRDVQILAGGVCQVLEKQGFFCENRDILKAYEDAGANVDYETHVATFPRAIIADFAESLRNEDKSGWANDVRGEDHEIMFSGFHPYDSPEQFVAPKAPFMFHHLNTYFHDDETGERRLGNHADLVHLIKLGDVVHPERGVGHILNLVADTPAPIEPLEAALTLLEYAHTPRGVYVHRVEQIPYLEEIKALFGIEDPYWHWMANICPTSPLKLDSLAAERYLYMLRKGIYPAKLAAMPVAGVNMPITVGGSVVIIAAEFIALWFAARIIQPKKVPLTGMPILGTMDLANGSVSFTAYDAAMRRFTICDFVRKWTGVQLAPGPGEWSPTKVPGSYCSLEKAYFAMMAAAFTGCHPEIGVGHIDAGLSISPVQFLLDLDLTNALHFLEKPDITQESLGLDSIAEIGFGFDTDFLTTDHTLANMRTATWMPESFCRGAWSPEAERALIERTKGRVCDLVAQYTKPEGRDEQLAQARMVVNRAKRALCT